MKKAFNYKRLALLFVPLALALIRVVYATEGEVDPSSMVAAHNKWRSEVGVADIMWSEILAETAQAWADNLKRKGCVLEHSKDSDYGENIYWAGPVRWSDGRTEVQSITPQNVVDNWGSEKENYNHGKNSCSGVCGHYTQVVWKNSMEVG